MKKLENRKLSPQFLKVFSSKTTPPLTWNMNMESFMEYMTAMVSPTILEIQLKIRIHSSKYECITNILF